MSSMASQKGGRILAQRDLSSNPDTVIGAMHTFLLLIPKVVMVFSILESQQVQSIPEKLLLCFLWAYVL